MKIIVTGIKEIDEKLKAFEAKLVKKAITKAMRDGAKDIKADVKPNIPVGTGELAKDLTIKAAKRSRTGFGILVLLPNLHAAAVEYGTSKMQGTGFMRKSFDTKANAVRDEIIKKILNGVNQCL